MPFENRYRCYINLGIDGNQEKQDAKSLHKKENRKYNRSLVSISFMSQPSKKNKTKQRNCDEL